MVQQNCQTCTRYWIKCGRDIHGYQHLSRDLHIPEAHEARRQFVTNRKNRKAVKVNVEAVGSGSDNIAVEEHKGSTDEHVIETTNRDTIWHYFLFKAALDGNWEEVQNILNEHGTEALRAKIKTNSETALHVAARSSKSTVVFFRQLLHHLAPHELKVTNKDGCTALAIAAKAGKVGASRLLISKNSELLYIPDKNGRFPVHYAAESGRLSMLAYMLAFTKVGHNPNPYDPEGSGFELLCLIIHAGFYDEALDLLKNVPKIATSREDCYRALCILAKNPSAFALRKKGVLQHLIYACGPKLFQNESNMDRTDNKSCLDSLASGLSKIHRRVWLHFVHIVPDMLPLMFAMHRRIKTDELIKKLCREAETNLNPTSYAALLFKIPFLLAVENGIHEIIREISDALPVAIWYTDEENNDPFIVAIQNRHPTIFSLLDEMDNVCLEKVRNAGKNGENILRIAAYLPPPNRLRVVSGAALQMQRELQWFKEIESRVPPTFRTERNRSNKTPHDVFTESHMELMKEGEKWMRDTASSCTVVSALIATIVFAAAITVPGGNNGEKGTPVFSAQKAFTVFAVADALSLFSSCVAVLMFLSILTSRYAERDFLRALPTRLIIGLLALFISVACMMAAFSSTLFLTFGHQHQRGGVLGCVVGPACLIVFIFARMQFKLLAEMAESTYRGSIFKRKTKDIYADFYRKSD